MPGRERFRNQIRPNLRNTKIIILVFDMTQKKTFLELDLFLEEIVNNLGHRASLILIGNKSDRSDYLEIKEKEAKKFAEIINAKCFIASAKDEPEKFRIFLNDYLEEYIIV